MKFNIEQLKEITIGAVYILEENGEFTFRRFTEEQNKLYEERNKTFHNRLLAPAGVKFHFKTDSKKIFIKLKAEYLLPRKYFSLVVFADNKPVGYIDNFSDMGTDNYIEKEYRVGEFSKIFALGPIWRKDHCEVKGFGNFKTIENFIEETAKQYENIIFIWGFDLVPEDERYFSDSYLHPNDTGFEHYIENLHSKIKKEI